VVPGGTLVNIGSASLEPSTINFGQGRPRGADCRIVVFALGGGGYDRDLSYLVDLVSRGDLNPQIGWRGNWQQVEEAATALLNRRVRGKVVLDFRRDE
jgi:NADPH:quinone reductase